MLFPEMHKPPAEHLQEFCKLACTAPAGDGRAPAATGHLPNTCTPEQAHRAIGVSVRQIKYWVEDGTLLAVNSARCPIHGRAKKKGKLDRWRVVVRRVPGLFDTPEMMAFPTLEELVAKASNARARGQRNENTNETRPRGRRKPPRRLPRRRCRRHSDLYSQLSLLPMRWPKPQRINAVDRRSNKGSERMPPT